MCVFVCVCVRVLKRDTQIKRIHMCEVSDSSSHKHRDGLIVAT